MPFLRALVLFLVCGNLSATWSIIIVDTRTGEVAIGSATCVPGWDLRSLTAVLVIGRGGACAQSYVDFSGRNRLLIFNGFKNGTSPKDILAALAKADPNHQTRQYGMVDTQGRAIGFTGSMASAWKGHLTGKIGTLVYAIQGNILTGAAVANAAETALKNTNGDLAAKLMAAMEAARKMGGDGRCSCKTGSPTSCGSPPKSFTKSSDIGFMMIGRQGDTDGTCNGSVGCATGKYYMNLNVIGYARNPDPVLTLKTMFDKWRKDHGGRPDHNLSTVSIPSGNLPADGSTMTTARLVLRDLEGKQLTAGGAKIKITVDPSSTASLTIGTVVDNKDGTYSFTLKAGAKVGTANLRITADAGQGPVLLSPRTSIAVTKDKLWVSNGTVPVATGGDLSFVINQGTGNAGRVYMLLASNSGTTPGFTLPPNQHFPLNIDSLFWVVFWSSGNALPGFLGVLDGAGRKTVKLPLPKGIYSLPVPSELSFATALFYPVDNISNPVSVQLIR